MLSHDMTHPPIVQSGHQISVVAGGCTWWMCITQDHQKTSLSQQVPTKCQTVCKARTLKQKQRP